MLAPDATVSSQVQHISAGRFAAMAPARHGVCTIPLSREYFHAERADPMRRSAELRTAHLKSSAVYSDQPVARGSARSPLNKPTGPIAASRTGATPGLHPFGAWNVHWTFHRRCAPNRQPGAPPVRGLERPLDVPSALRAEPPLTPAHTPRRARCAADLRRHAPTAPCAAGRYVRQPCGCRHRCRAPRPGPAAARATRRGRAFP